MRYRRKENIVEKGRMRNGGEGGGLGGKVLRRKRGLGNQKSKGKREREEKGGRINLDRKKCGEGN